MKRPREAKPLVDAEVIKALRPFWHRTRALPVPLTGDEWEERTGMPGQYLVRLCRNHLLRPARSGGRELGRVRIYELSDRGLSRLRPFVSS